jgi:L-histidine Nalpha-methyltransferase / hercynylcysteine S-oxide synthase
MAKANVPRHLSNDGVEETPPSSPLSYGTANGSTKHHQLDPNKLFIELADRNIGFRNWHPTPVTGNGHRLCGQSDLGGLWEWTSTPLASHEGFRAMDLYPGYTADFFDGKHNVCLGGSWATVPRIALRKTFVNWYQRNYPYVWCTARLVRNVSA